MTDKGNSILIMCCTYFLFIVMVGYHETGLIQLAAKLVAVMLHFVIIWVMYNIFNEK